MTAWLSTHGLFVALLIGLAARVVLITIIFGWGAVPTTSDDATYVRFAGKLLEDGRIATHFPLGYSVFVAGFLSLGEGAFVAIRAAHVLAGLLTVLATYRISELLFGRRAGLIAAFTTALYPPLAFMTGRIMSETLFICLLTLSLLAFVRADREGSARRSALGALLFGVGSTVRSNLIPMVPFIPLWLLSGRTKLRGRLERVTTASVVLVVVLALPGFFFLQTTGEFVPLATNGGQTLYGANNPLADGGWVEVNDHPELLASVPEDIRESPALFDKAQRTLALTWMRDHPTAFLSLLPKKFANAWIPGLQRSETTERSPLAAAVLVIVSAILILAAVLGRALVRPAARDGILLGVLATYTAMSLIFYGNPRIGLFCAPILIVYGSAFGSWLWVRLVEQSARP